MRRKPGTFIDIELSSLAAISAAERDGAPGVHGFLIAKRISADRRSTQLAAHGTLYRALDRLQRWGYLDSVWEDPTIAAEAGRPRRRLYRLTAAGQSILERQPLPVATEAVPLGAGPEKARA